MLASTAGGVAEGMESFARSSVEWKLDGIRIQIHRRGDEVRVYTRNLNEITPALPGIVEAVRRLRLREAVLDGEALWMGADGPAAFQDTVAQIDSGAPPEGVVTFLFDLLHLDGEDLLDTPLEQRVAKLEEVAPQLKVPALLTSDPSDGERVLEEALRAGHEGVVVKDAGSVYAAGRRGKAWRKVKPVLTYDLVVLGAEWGHGRRKGWLSNLHLGARDPESAEFVMVGKCFKGLTDELLEWQTKQTARAGDRPEGDRGARPSRAGGRDRARRRPVLDALPGRRRPALRAREALPAGQGRRRGGHDRRAAGVAPKLSPCNVGDLADRRTH